MPPSLPRFSALIVIRIEISCGVGARARPRSRPPPSHGRLPSGVCAASTLACRRVLAAPRVLTLRHRPLRPLMPLGRGTSRCVVRPVRLPSCDLVARFRALTAARSARLFGKRTRGRCRVLGSVPGSVRRQRCPQPSPSVLRCSHAGSPRSRPPDPSGLWRFTAARPPGSCDGRSRQLLCGACGVWPSRVPLPVGF